MKMEWWKEPLRIVHIFPAGSIDKFDAEKYAEEITKLNANAVHYDATWESDSFYYARYNSKIVEKHPQLGNRDLLEEVIFALHKKGIKIFVYVDGHPVDEKIVRKHPDWVQMKKDGQPVKCYGVYYGGCINSSWGDYKCEIIEEIAENYDVDGIFLDGPAFFEDCCYCQNCQKKFKELFGAHIPVSDNTDSLLWKKFIAWKYDCISEYAGRVREIVHSVRANIIFYSNGIQGLHRLSKLSARDAQRVADKEDIVGVEAFMNFPVKHVSCFLLLPGANAKYTRAVAEDKTRVVFTTYGMNPYYFVSSCKGSLETMIYQIFANGSGVWLEMMKPVLKYSPQESQVVAKTYEFIRKKSSYYQEVKSLANVALFWSRQTGDYYDPTPQDVNKMVDYTSYGWEENISDPSHCYLTCFWGMYDALIRNHIPFDLLVDKDLEDERILSKYKVLILENAACLSNNQNEKIRNFVAEGGGLIASYETSLYNEIGEKGNNFGLSDLFGVKIKGEKIGPLSNSYIFCEKQQKPLLENVGSLIPASRYNVAVETRNDVSAYLLVNTTEKGFCQPVRIQLIDNNISKDYPFLITKEYNKGRVVYTAGSLGDRYFGGNLPGIKQLIKNAVDWTGKNSVPIEFCNLAETVEVVLTYQQEHKRSIIHFVNLTGQMVVPIENIVPIYDIKVTIKKEILPYFDKVTLLVANQEVEFKDRNGTIEFNIPKLDTYEMVVLQEGVLNN